MQIFSANFLVQFALRGLALAKFALSQQWSEVVPSTDRHGVPSLIGTPRNFYAIVVVQARETRALHEGN